MKADLMATAGQEILIKDAMVFLFAAGVAVPAFRFVKLPAVVGFMLTGVALGPFGLGQLAHDYPLLEYISISEPSAAAPFAELGVLFLLFLLGLEFSFEKLWGLRKTVFGVGGLQAGLSALALTSLLMLTLGLDPTLAAICGFAMALSSTAIVMQLLVENKTAATPVGRTSFGVLLFQDILVAPILIFVGLVSLNTDAGLANVLIRALIQGLVALAIIFVVGKFLLKHIFRAVAVAGGRDFLLALTLFTVVGAAAITASAGLSLALGAFLAGLLLGETEFKHQTEVDLEPFKGILLGLFFMTVGMGLNLPSILGNPVFILVGLVALLSLKLLIAYLSTRVFGNSVKTSLETAFLLAPAGEFAFIVIAAAMTGGLIDVELASLLSAIAGLSMLLTPALAKLGNVLANAIQTNDTQSTPEAYDLSDKKGHVLLAGYGRVGQVVARMLNAQKAEVVALDLDARLVAQARDSGIRAYLGDAARSELVKSAGIEGAALFIATTNNPAEIERMVEAIRAIRPDIPILARAHDQEHANKLERAGANLVVPEVVEAGLQLAGAALTEFGYERETVRGLIAYERDGEYHRPDEA